MSNLKILFDGSPWSFVCPTCFEELGGRTQQVPLIEPISRASAELDQYERGGGKCQWCDETRIALPPDVPENSFCASQYIDMDDPDIYRRAVQIDWLRALRTSYEEEHDWDADEDPMATTEMLDYCRDLADELAAALPDVPGPAPIAAASAADPEIPF